LQEERYRANSPTFKNQVESFLVATEAAGLGHDNKNNNRNDEADNHKYTPYAVADPNSTPHQDNQQQQQNDVMLRAQQIRMPPYFKKSAKARISVDVTLWST
jgi:hypothetical protein